MHGWVAYLEDRALQWAALPASERDAGRLALVDHCTRALTLLTHARLTEFSREVRSTSPSQGRLRP